MSLDENEFCNSLYGEIQGQGLCGGYVSFSHKALEKRLGNLPDDSKILEVGGNLGEHCRYVQHRYREYLVTDLRKVNFIPINDKIRFEKADVEVLQYGDASFDRVLSTCLLHHLASPEQGLLEMRRVLKPGGLISLTLPCDPGFLYRVGKAIGPYRRLSKNFGVDDPKYLHYVQHRNHFPALESIISHVFKNDKVIYRTYPFSFPFWNLNLFRIYQIRKS